MLESKQLLAKYIILAEDDADDVAIFNEVLADITQEVKVHVAENGKILMDKLLNSIELPDLIFLDLNMPLKNGIQCLKEIKENEKWQHIKIVILSTSSHQTLINSTYDLGADMYLPKFISFSEFKENLIECLQFNWDDLKKSKC